MNFKPLIPALLAITAMTLPAHATSCIERTVDGGTASVRYIATYSGGHDGWDGTGGQCTKPGSARIWVGPRDGNGVCLTPASLIGSVAGPVYATKLVDLPDTDEFAKLDVKATAKAIAKEVLAALLQHRAPNPVAPIYGGWSEGSCP